MLTGTVILFLNSQTTQQNTFYIFETTNVRQYMTPCRSTLNLARRSIQSPSPAKKSSYPSQTQNHYYYAIYNSCKFGMLDGIYYFMDQQRQYQSSVFKTLPSSAKVLGSSIISIIMILTSTFHFNCNCFRMFPNHISVCL